MKKKTISIILLIFNICLLISIVFLIAKINARGPKPEETAQAEESVVPASISDQLAEEVATAPERTSETYLVVIPAATTSVNVRSGPGTEYQRVGSAYADCEYRVVEVVNSEWTKVDYDGEDGYLYNDFIKYQIRTDYSDGTTSYDELEDGEDVTKYINTGNNNDSDNENSENGDSDNGGSDNGDSDNEDSHTEN